MKISITYLSIFVLLQGASIIAMEPEERKEKSFFEEQLEQVRKEQATKFAQEQEKKKKEAERKKKKKTKKEPEVEPGRGKEEVEPALTKKGQEELFEKAKEAIEKERETLKEQERKEKERKEEEKKQKAKLPESFAQFLKDNREHLVGESIDEELVQRIIAWIKNNQVDVNAANAQNPSSTLLHRVVNLLFDLRIIQALLHNPHTIITVGPWFTPLLNIGMPRDQDAISALLLFLPFMTEDLVHISMEALRIDVEYRFGKQAVQGLLPDVTREASMQNIPSTYIAETKNMEIIKMLLLFASYVHPWTLEDLKKFKENYANLTGNETAPDGTSALMFAVGGGYLELVRELLRRGANPFQANIYGDNAFSIAEIQLERASMALKRARIEFTFSEQSHSDRARLESYEKQQFIYQQIVNALEEYAHQAALGIAKEIEILMTPQKVRVKGKPAIRPGLPYEVALEVAIAGVNERERGRILRYLDQLTPQEIAAPVPTAPAEVMTIIDRLRDYLPAWQLAALYYYLSQSRP